MMKITLMSMVLSMDNDDPKSLWDEEDKFEDNLIEKQIEDELQTLVELEADEHGSEGCIRAPVRGKDDGKGVFF